MKPIGVATHCTVWVNGVLAARNWCGSDVTVIAVPVACPALVNRTWRLSPASTARPDPHQSGDTDMNTGADVQPGRRLPTFNGGGFAIYRAQFRPRAGVQKSGGRLNLRAVTGQSRVWIGGKLGGTVRIVWTDPWQCCAQ